MSRDRAGQLDPRPPAIRRPTGDTPAARAADVFQSPAPAPAPAVTDPAPAAARRGRPRTHSAAMTRTTVLYPDAGLPAWTAATFSGGLKTPARLAATAVEYVRVAGVRTTLDVDVDTHRRLKILAAEKGVTVQSLILAAVHHARPEML